VTKHFDQGWVYFAQAGEDGPVKIGTALEPVTRVRAIWIPGAPPVSILRLIRGGGARLEGELHERFDAQRIRGEWFAWEEPLRSFVLALPIVEYAPWEPSGWTPDPDEVREEAERRERILAMVDSADRIRAHRMRLSSPANRTAARAAFQPGSPLACLTNRVRERARARGRAEHVR